MLLEVSRRPERHRDLLDVAERQSPTALLHFERGSEVHIHQANERLPLQHNTYYGWYSGKHRDFGANLLHQDGRLCTLQHGGKVVLLAQPKRRENGYLRSLRLDALLPLNGPVDEMWLVGERIEALPLQADWETTASLRIGDVYVALRPLRPTDLGGASPAFQIAQANGHLIVSVYNLRSEVEREFPAHVLDQTHNGLVLEIGSARECGDFSTFRKHIASVQLEENLWLNEVRQVRYTSWPDELHLRYNPSTQTCLTRETNNHQDNVRGFYCPGGAYGLGGYLKVGATTLQTQTGLPAWLIHEPQTGWTVAALPSDHPSPLRLSIPGGVVECAQFGPGRIQFRLQPSVELVVDTLHLDAPLRVSGVDGFDQVLLSGQDARDQMVHDEEAWVL